jgi:hydrogen peroxide-dependent heme synthase
MSLPVVKLSRGIHVMHLFYNLDRKRWSELPEEASRQALASLEKVCADHAAPSHPRLTTYVNSGGKADMVFMLTCAELAGLGEMHRAIEASFPGGTLIRAYSYLSVTELPDYVSTDEDHRNLLVHQEKLSPGTEAFEKRLAELRDRQSQYEHYRLYPEMPDWEVMAFYPMSKRRQGSDNWYSLEFEARKRLMAGHARVGRKFAGRVSQLITGSTGLDDWEWGVTLMSHQVDALKEIVYEMRFDEVSARYGEFGPFYVNMRVSPADLWTHLRL